MKKTILILFILTLSFYTQAIHAQNNLNDFRPGARAAGLGGSLTALADDATAVYWNPALLPSIHEFMITIGTFNPFFIDFGGASYFLPPRSTIGFSLARTGPDPNDYQIGSAAWGIRLSRTLCFGTNVGILTQKNETWPTAGFGFLFTPKSSLSTTGTGKKGLQKLFNSKLLADRTRFAFAIGNIPLVLSDIDHEIRFGISYRFNESLPLINLGYHIHRGKETSHLGIELPLVKGINVMAGVENLNSNYFAGGIKIFWNNLDLNLVYSSPRERVLLTVSANIGEDTQTQAIRYYEKGVQLVRQGKSREALVNFQSALALGKTNGELRNILSELEARIHMEDSQIDSLLRVAQFFQSKDYYISATINYLKILQLNFDHREAIYNIRLIKPKVNIYIEQLYKGGVDLFQQNDYIKATEIFQTILLVQEQHEGARSYLNLINNIYAEQVRDHYHNGLSLYGNGDLEGARDEFEFALAIDPDFSNAKSLLEEVKNKISQLERQVNSILSEAIRAERYGRHESAYLKYKEVLTKSTNNESAQRGVNRLKPIVDSSIRNLLSRGKQQFQNGNYDEARQYFRQVLQASPGHQEASRYINRIILAKNQQVDTHYNAGLDYYNSKNWTAALSEFDKALALKPDHRNSLQMRKQALASMSNEILMEQGDVAFKRLDFLKAWSLYTQVLKNDPNYNQINEKLERCQTKLRERVELFFDEGMTFYSQQKYVLAVEMWDKALKINPNHAGSKEYKRKAKAQLDALKVLPIK